MYIKEQNRAFLLLSDSNDAFILVLMLLIGIFGLISSISMTAIAQEENNTATTDSISTTGNTSIVSSGIQLSPEPVYQERVTTVSETPINQTHVSITFTGNGTLILPTSTQPINTTSNGSVLISFATQSAQGKETIITEDGEAATATFYEIVHFNPVTSENKGIVIAVVHANSTGKIAPLNGIVLVGIDDIIQLNDESQLTLWQWQTGRTEEATPESAEHSLTNITISEIPPISQQ